MSPHRRYESDPPYWHWPLWKRFVFFCVLMVGAILAAWVCGTFLHWLF